mmetsp:Transcript_27265/g.75008  ORF Transcript_27265/g.75008 Transcript_27265/m.75008 type:complete len:345 (+) Transcript_27265:487-1521(+)
MRLNVEEGGEWLRWQCVRVAEALVLRAVLMQLICGGCDERPPLGVVNVTEALIFLPGGYGQWPHRGLVTVAEALNFQAVILQRAAGGGGQPHLHGGLVRVAEALGFQQGLGIPEALGVEVVREALPHQPIPASAQDSQDLVLVKTPRLIRPWQLGRFVSWRNVPRVPIGSASAIGVVWLGALYLVWREVRTTDRRQAGTGDAACCSHDLQPVVRRDAGAEAAATGAGRTMALWEGPRVAAALARLARPRAAGHGTSAGFPATAGSSAADEPRQQDIPLRSDATHRRTCKGRRWLLRPCAQRRRATEAAGDGLPPLCRGRWRPRAAQHCGIDGHTRRPGRARRSR